jgi:DNA primase
VATLGTATTPEHAELLFRNAADVYFCFDGDKAGRGAAWKAVESVLPRMRDGRQAFFLFLPEGEDPDSIVRKEGSGGFEARLEQATPLSDFFFAEHTREVKLDTMEGRARLAERAKPQLAQIPDGAFRDLMFQRLAELARLNAPAAAPAPAPAPPRRAPPRGAPPPKQSLVRAAITFLVQQPALADSMQPPYLFAELRQPGVPLLVELIAIARARPGIGTGALLEHFAGREEEAALQKLALVELPGDGSAWAEEFLDALAQLDRQTRQQRVDELNDKLKAGVLSQPESEELRELLGARSR